jgi:hypothetical protein
MPLFAVEMKHSPEMSPIYNDKVREMFKVQYSKMEEVREKHEVKILSNLYSLVDHTILVVLEAPNIETVDTLLLEVGFVSFNTIKVRHVIPGEEIVKELLSKT